MIRFARFLLQLNCDEGSKGCASFPTLDHLKARDSILAHFCTPIFHCTSKSHLEIRYDLSRNTGYIYIYTFTETRTFLEDKRGTGIHPPRLFLRFLPSIQRQRIDLIEPGLIESRRKEKRIERVVNVEKDVARLFLFPRSTFLFVEFVVVVVVSHTRPR